MLKARQALFPNLQYCWMDTLCIDQKDDEDKKRQIPLMGDIYGGAKAVIILTRTEFGLTQTYLDNLVQDLAEALAIHEEECYNDDVASYWSVGPGRQKIVDGMKCLEIFTRPAWGTRVWTLQEYILAGRVIWIGSDEVPLEIDDLLFMALPDLCDTFGIQECIGGDFAKIYHYYSGMVGSRRKKIDQTRVMELLGNRTATFADDEIYGAMAATGVVIDVGAVKGQDNVWKEWWKEAVRKGHHRCIFLPSVSRLEGHPSGNCIMPSFATRHKASQNSGLNTVSLRRGVKLSGDSVLLQGRYVGSCKVIRRLGIAYEDKSELIHRDLTPIIFGNGTWQSSMHIIESFCGGRYSLKQRMAIAEIFIYNYASAKQAVEERLETEWRLKPMTAFQDRVWKDFIQLMASQMISLNDSTAHLLSLKSKGSPKRFLILISDSNAPPSNLHAIDFGVKDVSKRKVLMVVEGRRARDLTSSSLHKVGMCIPNMISGDFWRSQTFKTLFVHKARPWIKYRIGGRSCTRCQAVFENKDLTPNKA